ncbi:MAG: enoyl-CoA hydratase/isomerase family protein [Gemmatimonadales bacterium]
MTVSHNVSEGIGRLVLDHPPLNILTRAELTALRHELDALAADPTLRVLILSARGKHFSAGADVGEHMPPWHLTLIPDFLATVEQLEAFPLPVIAAVRGKCLGGGFELIQPADIIVAGEGASFGQPEIVLGVFPPAAVVLLPGRVPAGVAAQLIYSGDPISAAAAERCGLVTRLAPDDAVEHVADELARRIARHSAAALRAAKRAVRGPGEDARRAALLRAGHAYLHDLMETRDAVEGLRAFVEKRQPAWSNM